MTQVTAGVDLGGTKIQTVVVSDGDVIGQARHPTPNTNAADVVAEIVASIHSALADAGMGLSELRAIAIGTPGSVDVSSGHVSNARNVPGFIHDVALGPEVSAAFGGTTVIVDNDVRAAVMGEFRQGAGRPYRNFLGVFVGTGVGGGLVLEGALRHGGGNAGEIGHTTVKPGGRRCGCTRLGCLEAYAGRQSIEQTARGRVDKGTEDQAVRDHGAQGARPGDELGHRRRARPEGPAHHRARRRGRRGAGPGPRQHPESARSGSHHRRRRAGGPPGGSLRPPGGTRPWRPTCGSPIDRPSSSAPSSATCRGRSAPRS